MRQSREHRRTDPLDLDRVDVDPATRAAVVRDYKGRVVAGGGSWAAEGKLQVALYALAVRERLGVDPVAAVYQPVGARDPRPRGVVRDDGQASARPGAADAGRAARRRSSAESGLRPPRPAFRWR